MEESFFRVRILYHSRSSRETITARVTAITMFVMFTEGLSSLVGLSPILIGLGTEINYVCITKKREKSGDNNLHRRAVFRVQCLTEPLAGNQLNNLGRVVRP